MDTILKNHLEQQRQELEALAADSDIVEVVAVSADRFVVTLQVTTLMSPAPGVIEKVGTVVVGLWLHEGFLRRPEPAAVMTLLAPDNLFHPNVRGHMVCLGHVAPGNPLVELVARIHELLSFNEFTCDEHDAMNHVACAWIRRNLDRVPLDSRPLKSRAPLATRETATREPLAPTDAEIRRTGLTDERDALGGLPASDFRIGIIELEPISDPAPDPAGG